VTAIAITFFLCQSRFSSVIPALFCHSRESGNPLQIVPQVRLGG